MQPDRHPNTPILRTLRGAARVALVVMLWLGVRPGLQAQAVYPGYVEAGLTYHQYSAGFGQWRGLYVRSAYQPTLRDVLHAEALFDQRFGDQGFLYKMQHTRTWHPRWFSRTALGTSSGGFYLPRLTADVQVARKWLPRQQLVTVAGFSFYDAKDVHRDYATSVEAQWYLQRWVFQGGVRWNLSNPGRVGARSQYLAVTYGQPNKYSLALRYGFGYEAYQLVEPLVTYAGFHSREVSLAWRQWLGRAVGVQVRGAHYTNPFYRRTGVQVGLFKTW